MAIAGRLQILSGEKEASRTDDLPDLFCGGVCIGDVGGLLTVPEDLITGETGVTLLEDPASKNAFLIDPGLFDNDLKMAARPEPCAKNVGLLD